MSLMDYARLGITFDTTQLRAGIMVLDQVAARGRTVGQAADMAGAKLSSIGKGAQASAAGLVSADAACVRINSSLVSMNSLALSSVSSMEKLGMASRNLSSGITSANQSIGLMSGAVGGLSALIGFQLLAQISNLVAGIGQIPMATARASDSLTAMQARLRFAFRGSSVMGERGRQDVVNIARESGQQYSQLAGTYADLAIAGRGPGLTQEQITGLTRAFTTLGRGSGSRPEEIGRAQWQFQQALSMGRLMTQDYRLMSVAIPTMDDALAAGWQNQDGSVGVSPNRIPQMVASGEITANKMVDALIRGVEELQRAGLELPETMATARGRLMTEWELLLEQMGEALNSSGLVQDMTNAMTEALRDFREENSADPAVRAEALGRGLVSRGPFGGVSVNPFEAMALAEAQREARQNQSNNAAAFRLRSDFDHRGAPTVDADMMEDMQQRQSAGAALFNRGHDALREIDPLLYQRQALTGYRENLTAALGARQFGDPEGAAQFEQGLARIEAQLGNIMTPFSRMLRDMAYARSDMATYGAGAGLSMAGRARDIQQQNLSFGGVSMGAAMDALFQQQLIGAINQTGAGQTGLDARRRILGGAAGQGAEAERLSRIELAMEGFLSEFGPYRDDPRLRGAADAERRRLTDESNVELDIDNGRRRGDHRFAMAADQRRLGALGDPAGQRALERELQIEAMRRDTRADLAPGVESDMRERFGMEDQQAVAERVAADRERLRTMREQLALGVRVGQAGRIEAAVLERMQELRRSGLALTEEQLRAERERVVENVRVSEQLQLQQERMGLLVDSARAAGQSISSAFHTAISTGMEQGSIDGQAVLDDLNRYASRILTNIMDATFLRPLETRITEMSAGWLSRIPGLGGGRDNKGVDDLAVAAATAADNLASGLAPAVADVATKAGLSAAGTAQETAATAVTTKALYGLTAAAAAASKALIAAAAAASASSGGSSATGIANIIASIFTGGGGGGGGGVTNPAYNGLVVTPLSAGAVRQTPARFPLANGGVAEWAEAGAEAILPLKRGPDGKLGVAGGYGGGGGGATIVINDQRGAAAAPVEQRESTGPNGEQMIEMFIRDKVSQGIGRGDYDGAMRAQYGSQRVIKRA